MANHESHSKYREILLVAEPACLVVVITTSGKRRFRGRMAGERRLQTLISLRDFIAAMHRVESSRVASRRRRAPRRFLTTANSAKARHQLCRRRNTGDGTPDVISGFDAAPAR